MPIDASIYGQQIQPKFNSPFEALSQILQVRNQQEAAKGLRENRDLLAAQRREVTEKLARENADREAQGQALQEGAGVRQQTLAWALKNAPNTVPSLTEFFDKADEKANTIKTARIKLQNDEADFFGDLAEGALKHGATPDAVKTAIAYSNERFPDYAESTNKLLAQLEGASPEQVKGFLESIMAQSPSRRQKPEQAPMVVSEGQGVKQPDGSYAVPLPKTEKITYGAPQTQMVNGKRSLVRAGSDGQMYNMNLKPISAEAIAPEPRIEAQGPQPGWQWVNRNGEEVYTNRVAPGDRPQNVRTKVTEDERKMAGFYGQMSDAIQTIDQLEKNITEKELYQIQTLPQEKLIGMLNRNELSEGAKRYLRAFEQFTESRLRPVSGAAIADSEYARDRRTYAKQYGETTELAKDRARARALALDSLKKRAGIALDDATTAPSGAAKTPPANETPEARIKRLLGGG